MQAGTRTNHRADPSRTPDVVRVGACDRHALASLLGRFGLSLELLPHEGDIPGSYWGGDEAGLVGDRVLARRRTPVHSVLHEACHYVCMDPLRRSRLHTDAGGDYDEENAVCYLQIILADRLRDMGRERMWTDMDAWGYGFRLGSAREWFGHDAEDARRWLLRHAIIDSDERPTWQLRGA